MKFFILTFLVLFFLCGCCLYYNFSIKLSKIDSQDPKLICKYVEQSSTSNLGHEIKIDYNTISVYNINDEFKFRKIFAKCNVNEYKYFIEIIEKTDYYDVRYSKVIN